MADKFYGKSLGASGPSDLGLPNEKSSRFLGRKVGRKIWPPDGIDFLFPLHPELKTITDSLSGKYRPFEDLFISLPGATRKAEN